MGKPAQGEGREGDAARQNAALRVQLQELQRVNGELEAFSLALSHDLRICLTRISSSGQALEEYGPALDQQGRYFVEAVNDGCRRAEALLDALLALSGVGAGRLTRALVDLSTVARERGAELAEREPGREVRFLVEPGVQATGDPVLLGVALGNMIGNAWKYTARVARPEIRFGSRRSADGGLVYFLQDNGAGFDGAQSDRLFLPFQRLHPPEEFPGTGLGLATVRRIVERHGGRVWGEGAPGRGATFSFTLED